MGTLFGLKAFAVAILGGITSAWGVMLAGLLFGVVEALITALLGSSYTQILTFALVIVALALHAQRPVRPRRGEEGMRSSPSFLRRRFSRPRSAFTAHANGYYVFVHGRRSRSPPSSASASTCCSG